MLNIKGLLGIDVEGAVTTVGVGGVTNVVTAMINLLAGPKKMSFGYVNRSTSR